MHRTVCVVRQASPRAGIPLDVPAGRFIPVTQIDVCKFKSLFAHKPWLIKHDGVVYHFYCAVGGTKGRASRYCRRDVEGLEVNDFASATGVARHATRVPTRSRTKSRRALGSSRSTPTDVAIPARHDRRPNVACLDTEAVSVAARALTGAHRASSNPAPALPLNTAASPAATKRSPTSSLHGRARRGALRSRRARARRSAGTARGGDGMLQTVSRINSRLPFFTLAPLAVFAPRRRAFPRVGRPATSAS